MNATRNTLAILMTSVSLVLAAGAAQAQPCGMMGGGPGMGCGAWGAKSAATVDARLAAFKTELKISPEQEAAWQAYAAKAKEQAERVQAMRASRPGATMSGADRLAFRSQMMKQRATELEELSGLARTLEATLSAEQRAVFDRCPGPMGGRGGGMRGRMMAW
jgi:hypothetical protein